MSGQKVQAGFLQAEEAGKTMLEVTNAFERVSEIVCEIATATGEQSRGIEQVNQAITQMDEVTQQNAALVEEGAAASQTLDDQAKHLNGSIVVFRLDHTPHGHGLSGHTSETLDERLERA